jgi:flagellar operon protein
MAIGNTVLYPNVTKIPTNPEVSESKRPLSEGAQIQKGEFDQSLEQAMSKSPQLEAKSASLVSGNTNATAATYGIKFSSHATQRLRDRQIQFDPETMAKMSDAINKADAKGVQDTLVLTDKAALIVSVPNRTVVTAMDRNNLSGNVFTNIDGAVII